MLTWLSINVNCDLSCAHVQRDIIKAVTLGFKYSFNIYPKYTSLHYFRISLTVYFWLYDIKCSKSTFIWMREKYTFTKKWCYCKCNINRKDCFTFGNDCFVNVSNIHKSMLKELRFARYKNFLLCYSKYNNGRYKTNHPLLLYCEG